MFPFGELERLKVEKFRGARLRELGVQLREQPIDGRDPFVAALSPPHLIARGILEKKFTKRHGEPPMPVAAAENALHAWSRV